MAKRKRRAFTQEFKAGAVRLVQESGKSVPSVARELDLTETALRSWVRQAEIDAGRGAPGALTTKDSRPRLGGRRQEPASGANGPPHRHRSAAEADRVIPSSLREASRRAKDPATN